ncbi:MAG: DUF4012 domain-containing protein [Actinomycetota bacterium]|nr:DUF4012 domain-containing protein [Actinomycetota bacterium]
MTVTLRRSPVEMRPPPSSPRPLLVLLPVALWVVTSVCLLGAAYRSANKGAREIAEARRSLGDSGLDTDTAAAHLDRAQRAFVAAAGHARSPVLAPTRVVPVIGRHVSSFGDLAHAAGQLTSVGAATVDNVQAALADAPTSGPERISVVRELAGIASRADSALRRISVRPHRHLVASLDKRWTELDNALTETRSSLHAARQVLDGVAGLLQGPRRYLVLAANNAEMRAGSGMFLSAATLDVANGSLTLGPMRPTGELTVPGTGVEIEGDLASRWGWLEPGREWRNLGTTPRFEVSAAVAARMWERLTGEHVHGVLALDVELLRAVLVAVGPVTVDDQIVTAETVVPRVLHDQYAGFDFHDAQGPRREQLGRIAAEALAAVQGRAYSLASLAQRVAAASRGRHFLAWSAEAEEQRIWHTAGLDGSMTSTSVALNVLNRGGNKLDQFLGVTATLDVNATQETTDVALHVRVRNQTPPGEPPYIAGPHPDSGVGEGDYVGILALNVPGRAFDVGVQGADNLVAAGSDGPTQVVGAPLLLRRGEEVSVVVRFRLPARDRAVTVVPSGRIPPVAWKAGPRQWDDTTTRVVRWQ